MTAMIYTASEEEYALFTRVLQQEIPDLEPIRAPNDGRCHTQRKAALAVVSVSGALGMELALGHQLHHTKVIWISDDRYFTRMAIRAQIFDFMLRPFTEEQFRKSVRYLTGFELEQWPATDHPIEWACACTAKDAEGICPFLRPEAQ